MDPAGNARDHTQIDGISDGYSIVRTLSDGWKARQQPGSLVLHTLQLSTTHTVRFATLIWFDVTFDCSQQLLAQIPVTRYKYGI